MNRKQRSVAVVLGAVSIMTIVAVASAEAKPTPPPAPYTLGQEVVTVSATAGGPEEATNVNVTCPTGKLAVSGGYSIDHQDPVGNIDAGINSIPIASRPDGSNWIVRFSPDKQGARDVITAYAVCVNADAPTS